MHEAVRPKQGAKMTICDAVRSRVNGLLKEKNMTLYRLEQNSGILHGSMMCIMNGRNKNVTLKTVMLISSGLGITVTEFLSDPVFSSDDLELE